MSAAGVVDLTAENPMFASLASAHQDLMEESHGDASRPWQFIIYPPGDPDAITLTLADVERLNDGEFLNDSLVDFWCRYVTLRMSPKTRERFHIFNSYLYTKLTQEDLDLTDSAGKLGDVLSWVKNVDVFSKDFILIPICERMHWSLAVVCYPFLSQEQKLGGTHWQVPCILHLNSIRKTQHWVPNRIRLFLQELWDARYAKTKGERTFDKFSFPGYYPPCPQQENEWDCGIFLIEYMERMCIADYEPTLDELLHIGDPNDFFVRRAWFSQADLKDRRTSFRDILNELQLEILSGADAPRLAPGQGSSQSPSKQSNRKHASASQGSPEVEAAEGMGRGKKCRRVEVEEGNSRDAEQPSGHHYICVDDCEQDRASTSVMCEESNSMEEMQVCEEVLPSFEDDGWVAERRALQGVEAAGGQEGAEGLLAERVCIYLSDDGDGDGDAERSMQEVPLD